MIHANCQEETEIRLYKCLGSAEVSGDVAEDRVDLATEQRQGGYSNNRDKGYNQSVLGKSLSLLIFQMFECYIVTS